MKHANYKIVKEDREYVIIIDSGPWGMYPTVTNDAEYVVEQLVPILHGRRLFYFDSEEQLDEIVIEDGKFAGFQSGGPDRTGAIGRG